MKKFVAILLTAAMALSLIATAHASASYRSCRGCGVHWIDYHVPGFSMPEHCFSCPQTLHCQGCGLSRNSTVWGEHSCYCDTKPPCKACGNVTCRPNECPGWEKCKRTRQVEQWVVGCYKDVWTWDGGGGLCTSWDCVPHPCFSCGVVDCRLRCWVFVCEHEGCVMACQGHHRGEWINVGTSDPNKLGVSVALEILKYIVKLIELDDERIAQLRCCGDAATTLTVVDALCVLKKVVGLQCDAPLDPQQIESIARASRLAAMYTDGIHTYIGDDKHPDVIARFAHNHRLIKNAYYFELNPPSHIQLVAVTKENGVVRYWDRVQWVQHSSVVSDAAVDQIQPSDEVKVVSGGVEYATHKNWVFRSNGWLKHEGAVKVPVWRLQNEPKIDTVLYDNDFEVILNNPDGMKIYSITYNLQDENLMSVYKHHEVGRSKLVHPIESGEYILTVEVWWVNEDDEYVNENSRYFIKILVP